jgi:hypothetical protein
VHMFCGTQAAITTQPSKQVDQSHSERMAATFP